MAVFWGVPILCLRHFGGSHPSNKGKYGEIVGIGLHRFSLKAVLVATFRYPRSFNKRDDRENKGNCRDYFSSISF